MRHVDSAQCSVPVERRMAGRRLSASTISASVINHPAGTDSMLSDIAALGYTSSYITVHVVQTHADVSLPCHLSVNVMDL